MSDRNVAYRYAKPLIDLSIERGILDNVYQDMQLVHQVCDENPEFAAILKNPIIRGYKKMGILKALFANKVNQLTMSLFDILSRRDREGILESVSFSFVEQYNILKNIQKVTLVSAIELSQDLKKELKEKVASQLGKTIIMEEKVDEALIGGFLLKVGNDQIIDNSIRSQLQRLKVEFAKSIQN
ncbi:MAG: ATP synthase F1 subunit delta [Bacteroidetes bacterium]|nr:MAG: ATP synthase F1 subunit delta [Bacteroidota bacterium]TAG94341.1 MAG: ATP synthase F1 subunit delta [Bacteroidota bacterium]